MEKVKVICKGNQHLLQMPNGDLIPGIIFTRVQDEPLPNQATCIVKLMVELVDTKDENNTETSPN